MSKKDNFSQAMFEMFGLGKAPDEAEEETGGLDQFDTPAPAPSKQENPIFPVEDTRAVPEQPPVPSDFLEPARRETIRREPPIREPVMREPIMREPPARETPVQPSAPIRDNFAQSPIWDTPMPAPARETQARDPFADIPQITPKRRTESRPESDAAVARNTNSNNNFFDSFASSHNAPVKRTNCTYFAEGTSMEGTLRADSDIEISGDFKGEIASDGKVTLHANTTSSIAAAELILVDCTLVGDAMVSGDVSINEQSSVTGNIRANNIICSGVVKGNMNVEGNITLTENAKVFGDIHTGTLAMSRGAKVTGKIDMSGG